MDSDENAAYIQSQVACALIEAMGMVAQNDWVKYAGNMPFKKEDFDSLIEKYGIHHNAIMGYLHR